jgi:hypothetical protein
LGDAVAEIYTRIVVEADINKALANVEKLTAANEKMAAALGAQHQVGVSGGRASSGGTNSAAIAAAQSSGGVELAALKSSHAKTAAANASAASNAARATATVNSTNAAAAKTQRTKMQKDAEKADANASNDTLAEESRLMRRRISRSGSPIGFGRGMIEHLVGTDQDAVHQMTLRREMQRMTRMGAANGEDVSEIEKSDAYKAKRSEFEAIGARHSGVQGAEKALVSQVGQMALGMAIIAPEAMLAQAAFSTISDVAGQLAQNFLDVSNQSHAVDAALAGVVQQAGGVAQFMATTGLNGSPGSQASIYNAQQTTDLTTQASNLAKMIAAGGAGPSGVVAVGMPSKQELMNAWVSREYQTSVTTPGPYGDIRTGMPGVSLEGGITSGLKNGWDSNSPALMDDTMRAIQDLGQASVTAALAFRSANPGADAHSVWRAAVGDYSAADASAVKPDLNSLIGDALRVPIDPLTGKPTEGSKSPFEMYQAQVTNSKHKIDLESNLGATQGVLQSIASGQVSLGAPALGQVQATEAQLAALKGINQEIVQEAAGVGQVLAVDRAQALALENQSRSRSYAEQSIGFAGQLASSQLKVVDLTKLQAAAQQAGLSPAAAMVVFYQNQLDIMSRQETLAERQLSRNQLYGAVAAASMALPGQSASDTAARAGAAEAQKASQTKLWSIQDTQFGLQQAMGGAQATSGQANATYGYDLAIQQRDLGIKAQGDATAAALFNTTWETAFAKYQTDQEAMFGWEQAQANTAGVDMGGTLAASMFKTFMETWSPAWGGFMKSFDTPADKGVNTTLAGAGLWAGSTLSPAAAPAPAGGQPITIHMPVYLGGKVVDQHFIKIVNGVLVDQSMGVGGGG